MAATFTRRKRGAIHTRMMTEYLLASLVPGRTSLASLARKYDVPLKTVERWAADGAWMTNRRLISRQTATGAERGA